MKLIVGLGNPGTKYDNTRHNVGFMFVNYMADAYHVKFSRKNNYEIAELNIKGEKVLLLKPQTFMNLSGEAVIAVCNFYKIAPKDILVICDDLDMMFGKLRVKENSSSGGHNGLKNIINHLHTQEFMRIKIGINNEFKRDVKSFVLSKFSKDETAQIEQLYSKILQSCELFIEEQSIDAIRNKLLN
ncbi:aminoacyl-tRNA hydrolase [Mollicutes bacterium LVI A0039]|nr:aminoacyl-tRNA hydrolase [Mollicutes bacterium LVI A0039]